MEQYSRRARPAAIDTRQPDKTTPTIEEPESEHAFGWVEAVRIAVVALAAVAVRLHLWSPLPNVSLLGFLGVLIGGWPIFRKAAENLAARRMTMELSMTIAIVAARSEEHTSELQSPYDLVC